MRIPPTGVGLGEIVADMYILEQTFIIFLDVLLPVNRSIVRYCNRVVRVARSDGRCVVVVVCLLKSFFERGLRLA